ncbi:MAG: hypothetical protein PHT75_00360 [Bacilli bacterium]|nr:hypothetical protein [Bacilli bacterium]MDD3304573.1 hypothetical protein [Bacilli bacterium]MDD4053811.1 hypothetical protein [Bacilli bacterium]MDD4411322.1 hypothetical protein [Bacilli bacterium]
MKGIKMFACALVGFMGFGIMSVNALEVSETFEKVFPNGELETYSVPFKNINDQWVFLDWSFANNPGSKELPAGYGASISDCDENWVCTGTIGESCSSPEECAIAFNESHSVKLVFNEYDREIDKTVSQLVKKIADGSTFENIKYYNLTDLNLVNYYASINDTEDAMDLDKSINYTTELKKDFNNSNLTYTFSARMGDNYPLYSSLGGIFVVYHNGIAYGYVDPIGIQNANVIYVPTDTVTTTDAYIAAAKERIKGYLGYDVEITAGGLRDTLKVYPDDPESESYDFTKLGDETLMGDYYYNVKLNGNIYQFVIIRDSSKMQSPEYKSVDLKSNIAVSSNNGTIPLDANINTTIITKTDDYKIKVNSDNVYVVDIQLKSALKTDYIAKLDNGKYLVSIPVPENLNGKEIIAYYITSTGEKEEHVVTVKDGFASFETDHFSTYILAEKATLTEANPQTFDGVINYFILGIVSLIGLLGTGLYLRKRNN